MMKISVQPLCNMCKKECTALCFYKKFGYSFNKSFRKYVSKVAELSGAPFIIIAEKKGGASLVVVEVKDE